MILKQVSLTTKSLRIRTLHLAFACLFVLNCGMAQAALEAPSGLQSGDEYRLVFVTSGFHNAASSNISDYNSYVQNAADAVGSLVSGTGMTWRAIASTGTVDARDNTFTNPSIDGIGVPLYRVDGIRIANNYNDLWDGAIQNALNVTELGTAPAIPRGVWTATAPNGVKAPGLGDPGLMFFGQSPFTDTNWVWSGQNTAAVEFHVYAISNALTVVPEPASWVVALLLSLLASSPRRSR